jgi:hypothetical protein
MRSDAATTTHLPTELLCEIFKNVDEDTRTLRNVSLTCQHFRSLAQALIFRYLNLNCFGNNGLSRQSARFDFYSSNAIAPFVRDFSMSGMSTEEYTIFVAKVFHALPRFINIHSLSCFNVKFTQFALHQASTISSLEHIVATNCSAPPKTDSLPMLRLRTFECLRMYHMDQPGMRHWLACMDPDHLQVLRVPLTEDLYSFFLANDNPSLCPFPLLHTVDFFVNLETLLMVPMFLSKTPMLRSLKLFPSYLNAGQYIRIVEGLAPPTACPVPHLADFRGPHKLLPIILGRATGSPSAHLRRLFLESIIEAGEPLDDFMNSFKSCHPPQLGILTHLHISLPVSMNLKSLAMLRDMFPVLQEFSLHASEKYRPSGLSCVCSKISCPFDPTLLVFFLLV